MTASTPKLGKRWRQMQDAIARAQQHPMAVMEAVAVSPSREDAAAALATLLDLDRTLSDQLLDLPVSEFVGKLPAR